MHQFDELDMWNARREELIREAQDARRGRSARRGLSGRMNRAKVNAASRWRHPFGGHEAA